MEGYDALLSRAISKRPDFETSGERFVVPKLRTFIEGRTTIWENFEEIRETLNREADHFVKFLLKELGTAGKVEGNRLILQGRFSSEMISSVVNAYFEEFVRCAECGRPDTKLIKYDRIMTLKCDACGAQRSIQKRKQRSSSMPAPAPAIEEGKSYELRIDAVGKKGDGIAKVDKFTIFVPGVRSGDIVKARINKIDGNLAFASKE
ncbi:translation initiation factor IF-2 subunit beta [Methanocella sp. CWC-04]|uniref:Translation initiation factor 2 subunit beta n=1 Tax=Methanooceanicella nereidis TaxID=2052831 RepID=A0AAP2RG47_9EURY|nr:translation initiation factor IF-2 subunit beta [Methanocella sp. CWC-04]MCD1295970.1 translation initiation factor IF-2 subunit beta [Methanocella sp. CWC-04]